MKKLALLVAAVCMAASVANAQNLLSNGDFNLPGDGSTATGWTAWFWNAGWANTEISSPLPGNDGWGSPPPDTWHIAAGAPGDGGGGVYQIVPATAGLSYELSVWSGADDWWLPTGTMSMIWLNDLEEIKGDATRTTVDPAVYGENYDIAHPWELYSLTATAPPGTTQVKVEFAANNATGSVGFDLASLTVVPEPGYLPLLALGSALLLGCRSRRNTVRA
jgi:hypothetical protein